MRLLLGLVFATGCAKDVTQDLEDLAARACGCADKKDAACGKAVLADMVELGKAKNVKGDERKAAEATKKLGECLKQSGVTSAEITEAIRPKKGSGSDEPAPTPGSGSAPAPTPTPEPAPAGSGSAAPGSGSAAPGSGSGSAR
jgi:hypothetical protein